MLIFILLNVFHAIIKEIALLPQSKSFVQLFTVTFTHTEI